jgi:hypothetical protein
LPCCRDGNFIDIRKLILKKVSPLKNSETKLHRSAVPLFLPPHGRPLNSILEHKLIMLTLYRLSAGHAYFQNFSRLLMGEFLHRYKSYLSANNMFSVILTGAIFPINAYNMMFYSLIYTLIVFLSIARYA